MTDSNVSLHSEGGQEESRGVHGKELGVDHEGAAGAAPEPHVAQDVVREHLLNMGQLICGLQNVNCLFQQSQLKVLNEKINLTQTWKLFE